jgi:hypothetical protein
LRRFSPWFTRAEPPMSADGRQLPPSLRARRRFRLFFAGRASKGGARGDLFRHHRHRPSFLLHDTSGRFPPLRAINPDVNTSSWHVGAVARVHSSPRPQHTPTEMG